MVSRRGFFGAEPSSVRIFEKSWIAGATRLKDGRLRATIDFQVRPGIDHRIKMTGLPGQVEEEVFFADGILLL
jgi:hypothetical protein